MFKGGREAALFFSLATQGCLTATRRWVRLVFMRRSVEVLLEDEEIDRLREVARRNRMTVDDWIRLVLREAWLRSRVPSSVETKLRAIQVAAWHEFPVGDIRQMLREIERGYGLDLPS